MMLSHEQIIEDDKRWAYTDIMKELRWFSKEVIARKHVTNDDLHFFAFLARKAYELLKEQNGLAKALDQMTVTNDYLNKEVERLEAEQTKWIPVSERLPIEKENPVTHDFYEVICYCQFGGVPKADDVRTFKFGNGHFYNGPQIMDGIVTHWQYLPEPPEDGEQE